MKRRKPTTAWLPSTEQIMVASEWAILAALDATLELTIRTLKGEHAALGPDGRLSLGPNDEPHSFDLLPVAEALVSCANRMRQLVADYQTVSNRLLE